MASSKLIPILAALCVSVSVAAAYFAWAERPQSLTIDEIEKDCGQVHQGDSIEAIFHLFNGYAAPVAIEEVLGTCDCQNLDLTKQILEPGESATLTVQWRIGRLRGISSTGVLVTYLRPDGRLARVPLRMKADVIPDISYEPAFLTFQRQLPETKHVSLRSNRQPGAALISAYADHQSFAVKLKKGSANSRGRV